MTKVGVLSRRNFLVSLFAPFAPAIAKPVISQQSVVSEPLPLLPGIHKPEFFFGEVVEFRWTDENNDEAHSERGEVVGVLWNFPQARWEYSVTWLSSTAYPASDYPIQSELITANVLHKVGSAR